METEKIRLEKDKETYLATLWGKAMDAAVENPILGDRFAAEIVSPAQAAELTAYRNRVSAMRAEARHHEAAQQEFMVVLETARQKLSLAGADLRTATQLDPSLRSFLHGV